MKNRKYLTSIEYRFWSEYCAYTGESSSKAVRICTYVAPSQVQGHIDILCLLRYDICLRSPARSKALTLLLKRLNTRYRAPSMGGAH
jgi:hypothetical protein